MNYVFISGPIRPNVDRVIEVIKNKRMQFEDSKIFFSTWKNNSDNLEIRNLVDYFIEDDEPTDEFIFNSIDSRTYQQTQHGGLEHWTLSFYKMFYGIKNIFSFIEKNNLKIPEKVIRTRSDLIISFDKNYLSEILNDSDSYFVYDRLNSGANFCDVFGISNFENMKKVWFYDDFKHLNDDLQCVWNIEELIKQRTHKNNLKISYFDKSKINDFYIFKNDFLQILE
jgi:hypothetical protein